MWKNFQEVLEKRVKNKTKKSPKDVDDFMLLKISKKVLEESFGKIGMVNLDVSLSKRKSDLKIKCRKSVWRSEVRLKQAELMKQINKECGLRVISKISVWS